MKDWISKRLHEASTWRGLVWLLAAAGITISPEIADAVAILGLALAGLLDVLIREKIRDGE
jgi:hypothetical protein